MPTPRFTRFRRATSAPEKEIKRNEAGERLLENGKVGVVLACATLAGDVRWSIAHQYSLSQVFNHDPQNPFHFATYFQVGARPFEYARNLVVQHFLEKTDAEWLYFWDADQEVPDNWWHVLTMRTPEGKPPDIVSGTTFCWVGTPNPAARLRHNQYDLDEQGRCYNITPKHPSMPYEVNIVGTACMAIRRHVLEALGPHPFKVTTWPDGRIRSSEDITFCFEARKKGFRIGVHPGVVFGHIKPIDLRGVADFASARLKMMKAGSKFTKEEMLSV